MESTPEQTKRRSSKRSTRCSTSATMQRQSASGRIATCSTAPTSRLAAEAYWPWAALCRRRCARSSPVAQVPWGGRTGTRRSPA